MNRKDITIEDFRYDPAQLRDHWLSLFAGDFNSGAYNAMTISWGSYGQIWNKMFFQVFVRPTRHTYEFMERYDTFTLNAFEPKYKQALSILGSKSGRDGDKIALAGLTPMASREVAAPCFREASLVIECRKMYWQDIDNTHFLDSSIEGNYAKKDYHRVYFGEIVHVSRA
jgi:flavin reductase (DIM6/NTAB) family NADH-FMN oxidoreductase RutF